jgi:aryl-alcohol dehydrogenase-like predicted oxidoreductase
MTERETSQLPRRRLGRTGLMVPAIGLGGVGIGGAYGAVSERDAFATVHDALARGINFIDTSPLYADSERRLGLALEGVPRDRLILSTKTGTHPDRRGDYSWDGTHWSVENSLRLLKTDYADLLLVHDPPDMAPVFAPRGALEALEALKAQGVVRHIGLGVRQHEYHRQAIESGRFDVILTYNDYHPLRTTAADWLLPLAAAHDVGVLNGSPFAHGLLSGEDPDVPNARLRVPARDLEAARRLYRWSREKAIPMPALILQFCLRQPGIHGTLTGAKTVAELRQNLEGAVLPLPETIWEELESLPLRDGKETGSP